MHNWDRMGLTPTKPFPYPEVMMSNYQVCVDWVRDVICRDHGIRVDNVAFDAHLGMWRFYCEGRQVANINHALMERIWEAKRVPR